MIIQVDQEGRSAVQQLCDIALKSAGMQNLNPVNKILRSVTLLPVPISKENLQPKSLEKEDKAAGQDDAEKQEEKPVEEKPVEEKSVEPEAVE